MKNKYLIYAVWSLSAIAFILAVIFVYKNFIQPSPASIQTSTQQLIIGGCTTKNSCIEYCSYPGNANKCSSFLVKRGLNAPAFPSPPGNCKSKEECNIYCKENPVECEYYAEYLKKLVGNVFDKNSSEIIIPVPSPNLTLDFYKIANSHFGDAYLGTEFERFKGMGINSYSFWVATSYILGDVAYDINESKRGLDGFLDGWETRASYYIGKSHLNGLKFVYFISPTDWDLWDSPQYKNPSQELIDEWMQNYTKAIREVAQFAQKTNVDVLFIGVDPAMIKIDRDSATKEELHLVYEKFLQEMLKETKKWYTGEIGLDFGNTFDGLLEFETIPNTGKFDYVSFLVTAKPIDESDPYNSAKGALTAIEGAKQIAEKNNAKGIILRYEFGEFGSAIRYDNDKCESLKPYSEETRRGFYNDLLNNTKDKVAGFVPVSTPLFSCDSENLLKVTEDWYKNYL